MFQAANLILCYFKEKYSLSITFTLTKNMDGLATLNFIITSLELAAAKELRVVIDIINNAQSKADLETKSSLMHRQGFQCFKKIFL